MLDKQLVETWSFKVGVIATALVAMTMAISAIHLEDIFLALRISVPIMILSGFVGAIYKYRILRLVGWVGIIVYVRCAIGMVIPGEDYSPRDFIDKPVDVVPIMSLGEFALRFVAMSVLVTVLIVTYRRVGKQMSPAERSARTEP